jgi:omega-hydroxy-beta-dihydromenaquinone-9 sulfotransferase
MDKLFPLPLFTLLKTATDNGGFSSRAFRNLPAWMIKTILFEPLRWFELLAYNNKIKQHRIEKPPVFILGYYRSGTTYLQQTFVQDARFGYLDNFQQILPEIMLSTEGWLKPVLSGITGALNVQNKMHRIKLTWDFPGEEDVAMTTAGWRTGGYWGYFFPRMMDQQFRKYTLFNTASTQEETEWLNNYVFLLKKISLANKGKQLLLKTPPNTARIKLLLSAFPEAKFIFIHRNPYDVFSSNKRLWEVVQDIYTIGKTDSLDVNNTIIESYAGMMNQYLSEKSLIPADQLFEIGYSEFAANPVPVMRNIYETLQLGDFEECEKRMTNFVTAKKNYAVLKHRLTDAEIELVDLKWSKFMNYWNYLPYQSRSSS